MTAPTAVLPAPRLLTDQPYGPLPDVRDLVEQVEAAGLTGRGGAGFPVARKLRAVRDGGRGVVVGNGAEGEPASGKDRALLAHAPHLVLDGLRLAAAAVGARRSVLYVSAATPALRTAAAERGVEVAIAPAAFLSGEESAVVSRLNGGRALPRSRPPAVYVKGVDGRPTLVQNVETLAHLALIARYGAGWFRERGTAAEPGTMLCTVSGAVRVPGVLEAPLGTPLRDVLEAAGGPAGPLRAVLVGGYHGVWVTAREAEQLTLSAADLGRVGGSPGAGVVIALGAEACPLEVSAGIVAHLARQSARQCGPCLSGLPALAEVLAVAAGRRWDPSVPARIEQLAALVAGRGACHHPDGTARLVRSVLATFPDELEAHAAGRCLAAS